MTLEKQMVENGIAVNGDSMFMVTSPAGAAGVANATGYMWSLIASEDFHESRSSDEGIRNMYRREVDVKVLLD